MIKALALILIGLIVYYIGYFLYKAYKEKAEKYKKEQDTKNYQAFIDEDTVLEQEKKK